MYIYNSVVEKSNYYKRNSNAKKTKHMSEVIEDIFKKRYGYFFWFFLSVRER